MLQSIIDYLTIKLQALKIADVYGLGELVVDKDSQKPCLYNGSGQYYPLSDFDNHSGLIYFRLVSPVSNTIAESQIGGDEVFQRTYNLRVVAYVNKAIYNTDNNYIDDKIAHNIQIAIDNEDDGLLSTSLGAQTATIQTITYDTNRSNVSDGESLDFEIPFDYVFLALDFNVIIIGSQDCFSTYGCNDTPIDYLELLRSEVCETECQQATAVAKNSDGDTLSTTFIDSGASADIPITDSTILRSDATTIATVPAQDPYTVADTPVEARYVNGTLISTTNVKAADSTVTIPIPNPETLNELVDSSTDAEVITAIELATKQNDVTDGLLAQYGGFPIMMNPLGSGLNNPCDCIIIGTSLYILNSVAGGASFVRIVDLDTGALIAIKASLGNSASAISKSVDQLFYMVVVSASGTTLLIRVSDNVTVATLSIGSFYGGDFIDNGNVWTTNNTNVINETTPLGVNVSPSITITALTRAYVVKRKDATAEMWIGGYDVVSALFNGRIFVYTQAKVAVRNFSITGSSYFVKSIAGIGFFGSRNFVVATLSVTAGSNTEEKCMALIEIDDNGNVIKEMPIPIISQSTNTLSINGLAIYDGYDRLTIVIGLNCSDRYALIVWE